jgi:hypothetical protein
MINLSCNKKMMEYEKMKNLPLNMKDLRKSNYFKNNSNIKGRKNENDFSFREEINNIKNEIIKDISDSNIKQAKDIIILIDFNIYEQELNNSINNVELFIDQTKTILNNYLSNNDRLGVIIYIKQYNIVCPLMCKNKIDSRNFCEDLNYYKKKFFNEVDDTEEYKSNISENDLIKEKVELSNNEISFESRIQEDSSDEYSKNNNNLKTLSGLLKSINFSKTYLKMKKSVKNEKYIILFTDLFNYFRISEEIILKKFQNLDRDKEIHFLFVAKIKMYNPKNDSESSEEDNEKKLNEIIIEKFGDKSELIDFENMKKIQTILASNNVIKDQIIYPNEIYK